MGNKWKAPGGCTGERGSECGVFLIVERVFGKLNWDSRARDEPPAWGFRRDTVHADLVGNAFSL